MCLANQYKSESIKLCFELVEFSNELLEIEGLTFSLDITSRGCSVTIPVDFVFADVTLPADFVDLIAWGGSEGAGFGAICAAFVTIAMMRLMSRWDARKTIGVEEIPMLVICCAAVWRLSSESVMSTSSKNRTLSSRFPICVSDMPRRVIVKATIPCGDFSSEVYTPDQCTPVGT